MNEFASMHLPDEPTYSAPDGSQVRVLLATRHGNMAHFELPPGVASRAVTHRSVEEIWYVVSGQGEMWRKQDEKEEITVLEPGVCLSIPLGTHFQFRAAQDAPLTVVAVTLPPWPGPREAVAVTGPWTPSTA